MVVAIQRVGSARIPESLPYGSNTLTTETTPDGPWGSSWLASDDGLNAVLLSGQDGAAATGSVVWGFLFYKTDSLADAEENGILRLPTNDTGDRSVVDVFAVGQPGGGAAIRLRDSTGFELGTSSAKFSEANPWWMIIVRTDGSEIIVWVNGVEAVSVEDGVELMTTANWSTATGVAGKKRRWCQMVQCTSSNVTDVTETQAFSEVRLHTPSDDGILGVGYDQYGDQVDCSASGNATYANWADWATGPNDGGDTYNCGYAGQTWRQTSEIETQVYANGLIGAGVLALFNIQGLNKGIPNEAVLWRDSATSLVNLADIDFSSGATRTGLFQDPPIGNWAEFLSSSASHAGHGRLPTPPPDIESDLQVTALATEGAAIGTSAPPTQSSVGFQVGRSRVGGGDRLEQLP